MALEGLWLAEFKSNQELFGKGVVVLETQRILGGDSTYYYLGDFEVEHNLIKAKVGITQHYLGAISIFAPLTTANIIFEQQDISENTNEKNLQGYVSEAPNLLVQVKLTKIAELP